jgi:hypothetical protein
MRAVRRRTRRQLSVALLGVAVALTLGLGLGGCGGEGGGEDVATAGDASAADSDENDTASDDLSPEEMQDKMRQFAACMREEGIDMPDPQFEQGEDGRGRVTFGMPAQGSGGAPDREKVEAARTKCQHLMPNGGEMARADPEMEEKMRAFARCMRENGVPNFPDPEPGGGTRIGPGEGIDPRDPAFQEARKKCEEFRPGDGPGSGARGGT